MKANEPRRAATRIGDGIHAEIKAALVYFSRTFGGESLFGRRFAALRPDGLAAGRGGACLRRFQHKSLCERGPGYHTNHTVSLVLNSAN